MPNDDKIRCSLNTKFARRTRCEALEEYTKDTEDTEISNPQSSIVNNQSEDGGDYAECQ